MYGPDTATIAVVNMESRHDKSANLDKIVRFIEEAASRGAQLLVLPEAALQGYPLLLGLNNSDEFAYQYENAEPIPGPSTDVVATEANRHGLTVAFGLIEVAGSLGPAGLLFNSLAVIGPDGLSGVYRKVHTGDGEKQVWHRGREFTVIETSTGKLGPLICYDVVFPECSRSLALQGAEILVMATAWLPGSAASPSLESGYDLFTRARALENQLWLVCSDQSGKDPLSGARYHGHSRIVDPTGQVVLELGNEEGLGVTTVDVRAGIVAARARSWLGEVFLRDRVPTSYTALTDSSLYAPPFTRPTP